MHLSVPRPRDWLLLAVALAVATAAVLAATSRPAPRIAREAPAAVAPGTPATTAVMPRNGVATTLRTTVVRVVPSSSGEATTKLRAGIVLPVRAETKGFVRVETPCELDGWVARRDVRLADAATKRVSSLRDATIVIDPGHGGIDSGAVGPGGLQEELVNLDISRRLQTLLHPARVFVTRGSNYTAGLDYRTDIATAVGAQVFVSVHNNASPDVHTELPGTETYYQLHSSASKRLAGLAYEELVRSLERFKVPWVAQRDAGAKYRINERGGDYYHVLRTSVSPAVIVEGLYISNPPEEALLRREDVRDLMARALARAITRFITTRDPGSGFVTPHPRGSGPTYRTPTACRDPA